MKPLTDRQFNTALNRIRETLQARYEAKRLCIKSPEDAEALVIANLASSENEKFLCIFLDTRHSVISAEVLFMGTIDGAEVHPRIVVKRAMELNAASLIVAHNHPSGNPEPSSSDIRLTAKLKSVLELVDVRLLDHLIVGSKVISLAARGQI